MVEFKQQAALEARLTALYNKHKEQSEKIKWNYYDYLPWDRGRSFIDHPWDESQVTLPKEIVVALETSMLTELNLPWYTTYLGDMFKGGLKAMHDFIHEWTSEEDQHASALETYLILTRSTDPQKLGDLKREMLTTGWDGDLANPIATMAYTSIQELATVVFYRNVAASAKAHDPVLTNLLLRLSKDESLHYAFYNQAIEAYLELDPDQVVFLAPIIRNFKMPGGVLNDFDDRMKIIEKAGYGPDEYLHQVLDKLIQRWKIASLQPVTPAGRKAKEDILKYITKLKRINAMMKRRNK
jgi:acyl-[acyl-carrier-protein] desaturase